MNSLAIIPNEQVSEKKANQDESSNNANVTTMTWDGQAHENKIDQDEST